jgi:molecular chaperone HscC
LEVEATIVVTRQKVTHVVSRHAKGMSAAQISQAVRNMAKLKEEPREERGNRLLLRRAERLFQELPAVLRENLSLLLDGFEGALSMRDADAIERHRQTLEIFLSQFDTSSPNEEDERDAQSGT